MVSPARLTLTLRKKKKSVKLTGNKLPAPGTVPTGDEDPFAPNPRPTPTPGGGDVPQGGSGGPVNWPGGLRPPGAASKKSSMRKKRSRKTLSA